MTRVKKNVAVRGRHTRLLALTKGQRATRHALVKRAHEAMMHSLKYAYFHRKERKGDMRRLWIVRISAAARANGVTYSQLMNGLEKAGIDINRKVLADLAVTDPIAFASILASAGFSKN